MDSIGIVGLGLIGIALARRLASAGFAVQGYDIAPARNALLAETGGRAVGSLRELGEQCSTILVSVLTTDQVEEVLEGGGGGGPMGLGPRHVVVGISTCDPERIVALAARLAERGVRYVEFPISGNSNQIALGNGVGLAGGETAVIEAVAPVLDAICRRRYHLGAVGAAGRAKLAVNLVGGLNRAVLAEGLAFAESMGIDLPSFLEVLKDSAAYMRAMDTRGEKMVHGDFSPHGKVYQSRKDFTLMHEAAARSGQALPLAGIYLQLIQSCVDHGESDLDTSVIINEVRRRRTPPRA